MTRLGMDPEVVEKVGRDLKRQAAYLEAVVHQVDQLVASGSSHWHGHRGRQFVADWQAHHRKVLVRCADSVRGLGQSALNNAQAQRDVSRQTGQALASPGAVGRKGSDGPVIHGSPRPGKSGHAADMAGLSKAVYDPNSSPPDGWRRLTDSELRAKGINPASLEAFDGYRAGVFVNAEGHVVLAFAGTDPGDVRDWATNVKGVRQATPSDYRAMALAQKLADATHGDLEMTGHSLGGRLAAEASIATGLPATTFDAAGPSNAALRAAHDAHGDVVTNPRTVPPGQITDYHVAGEILDTLQHGPLPGAVGDRVTVDISRPQIPLVATLIPAVSGPATFLTVVDAVDRHGIGHLEGVLAERARAESDTPS